MSSNDKSAEERRLLRKQTRRRLAIATVLGGSIIYSIGAYLLIGSWGGGKTITVRRDLSKLPLAARLQSGDSNLSNDEIRAAALQLDQQLMNEREELSREREFSGRLNKPYQGWYQRVNFLENELQGVENPAEDSVEWHMQRELARLQEDKPSR